MKDKEQKQKKKESTKERYVSSKKLEWAGTEALPSGFLVSLAPWGPAGNI